MPTSRHYLTALLVCAVQTLGACSSCGGDPTIDDDMGDMSAQEDMDTAQDDGSSDPDDMDLTDDGVIDPDGGGADMDLTDDGMIDPDGGGDMTDMGDMNTGGDVVACDRSIDAPPAGSLCNVTQGTGSNVVLRGTVLGEDGKIYENGAVIFEGDAENGEILYVGCEDDMQTAAMDATLIECADGVIAPGTLNAHDHLTFNANGEPAPHGDERFDHRHDWRKGLRGHMAVRSKGSNAKAEAVQYSELRHLMAGTTSIAGSGGAGGFTRNLDVATHNGGLDGLRVDYSTFPLGDSGGELVATGCDYPRYDSENVLNNTIYLPHVSEGIDVEANNEFKCLNGGGGRDLIAENTSVIHGIGLTAADIADMSASGSKLVWSPRTNIDLYGQTADVLTYRRLGVTIALGTDWIISGSMNMQRELACASYLNDEHYNGEFSDRELFEMATINGATALGIDNRLGSLREGKIADIVLYDGTAHANYRAVIDSEPGDVELVLRGGQAIYGDAALIDGTRSVEDAAQCEAIDVCGASQKICAELDTGSTIAAMRAEANNPPYPLFFCDTPTNEPSCVPARPDEYTGVATATDADGDGIEDGADICPEVFNPARPLSMNEQPNFDQDLDGDSCDVCPVSGAGDMCAMFDPNDRDSDGTPNADDNCPTIPNMDQADGDSDGTGDLCDACPQDANPSNGPCPATIYDINQGAVAQGATVLISDAVVSGAGADGFFIQVPTDAAAYIAPDYSGIFVYAPDFMSPPTRGDRVELSGTVAEFRGGTQLTEPSIVMTTAGMAPAPITVSAEDVARTGSKGEAYEGLLVRVEDVEVTDVSGYDMFGEVALNDGLYLGDVLYAYPKPEVGDTYASLTGLVVYRDFSATDGNRIAPRDDLDFAFGEAGLAGFNTAAVQLETNQTGASTTPGLFVELTNAAGGDVLVDLTYGGDVSGPASVIIAAGERVAEVLLTSTVTAGSGVVTATYQGMMASVTVDTFDAVTARTPVSLSPQGAAVAPNGTLTMTVTFDVPGLADGSSQATITTSAGLTAPAVVMIPAGAIEVDFDVTAMAGASGPQSVEVATATGSVMESVDVTTLPSSCLIISEVGEGGSFNKAVELYNCGASDATLAGKTLCEVNGANMNCTSDLELTGTLAAGATLVVCNSQAGMAVKALCDIEDSVANFNGNDRLILFEENGGAGNAYDAGTDVILDAFGEFGSDPGDIWKDKTYDRCNFTPYNGVDPFDALTYFNELPKDTFTGLGVAPTMGCN